MAKEIKPTELTDADLDDAHGGGTVPVDSFSLNFEKIRTTLTRPDGVRVPGIRHPGARAGGRATKS